jgi:hypothetical protein
VQGLVKNGRAEQVVVVGRCRMDFNEAGETSSAVVTKG